MKIIVRITALLSILLIIAGCEKPKYEVKLDKESIECDSNENSYQVEITTDGTWTAEARNSSGFYINWITLTPSSGKGKATLTVSVKKNEDAEARTALVTVTSSSGNSSTVKIRQSAYSETPGGLSQVRLGNFNMRISPDTDYDTGNGWDVRKNRVVSAVKYCDFDIFGMQEVSGPGNGGKVGDAMQKDLRELLGDTYEFKFFSPYSQNGNGKSSNGIAYKKDKFTLSNYKYFWIAENPDIMITNDGGHNRGGCCAIFTHNSSGSKLFFMEVHAPLDKTINNNLAYVYSSLERTYNPEGYPSVLVGDMNNYATSDAYKTITGWWQDSYTACQAIGKVSGPSGTYNGFDSARDMNKAGRIDYIFFRGPMTPVQYVCHDALYDGFYPSDHLPIYCDFKLSPKE